MILLAALLFVVVYALTVRFARSPAKGWLLNFLKAFATVATVVWLLLIPVNTGDGGSVPAWRLIVDQISAIDPTTFWVFVLLGSIVRISGVVASMYRWLLVLRGQGIELPFRHIFGSFLIGRAIGFFFPSTAGLDAYTLYDAARFSGRTVEVTAGKVLEKVIGFSGIFLSFLVALPFGIAIFGENAAAIALITVPVSSGIILALMVVLWYPGIVQWGLENIPIPGKAALEGVVMRISRAAAAYRDKKQLVVMLFVLSFLVHFTTAAMYYFMAVAIGAGDRAEFWPVAFGSSIQILATVLSPFTIGGMGIREAAQYAVLGNQIGPAAAIISATLGFWVGEFPTLFGFVFWLVRKEDYRPAYCLVDGEQVDYEESARAATQIESPEEKMRREQRTDVDLPSLGERIWLSAKVGLGAGIVAGLLVGLAETAVIAAGGFGGEAQVLWYGPLAYAALFGILCTFGGIALGILPMSREEIEGWTPSLAWLATLVPFGLFIVFFRLRRDVYLEQMPPMPVLGALLGIFGGLAFVLFFGGRRIFGSPLGRIVRPVPALATLVLALVLGAIGALAFAPTVDREVRSGIPSALASAPNVILVMVDTLRADHLECYGAKSVETPNLCSLAADGGSVFDAFSHASWTKPATASLLSSLVPSSHNAMSKPSALGSDADLISEVLQERGYTTGGIVSNINLAESFGFDQGYDEYHYLAPDYLLGAQESSSKLILYQLARQVVFRMKPGLRFGDFYQDSEVVNSVAFDWLDRNGQTRFFLFLHYMDPHDPYFEHPYNGKGIARVSNPHPDPALAEEMHDLYIGEIEYLDANFGKLLAKLEAMGIYDDTIIALVADHGEEFYEHDGWWHGLTLYDEQINVPLVVKWAKGRQTPPEGATDEIARLIDVAPTLISRTGARVPESMQGIDLLADPGQRAAKDRQVFSEEDHEGNVLWSLRTREHKLIEANSDNPRGLPESALFDIVIDPGEENNLAGNGASSEEETLRRYADLQRRAALGEAIEGGEEVEMSRAECEQLKNLGYVEDCSHIR